jgi:hypothetical protein
MEKKEVNSKFYILSLVNLIPVFIFGGGLTWDSLVLFGALIVLMLNHVILVKLVKSVTQAASGDTVNSKHYLTRVLLLMALKFSLLFGMLGLFYYFKRELITKLFLLIIFQLIIQVLSIKNNYQNS